MALPDSRARAQLGPVGGEAAVRWVVDIEVDDDDARTDLKQQVAQVAGRLGLSGPGVGLLTAAPRYMPTESAAPPAASGRAA